MPKSLRSSGIVFAVIFLAGFMVNLVFLWGREGPIQAFLHPYQISLIVVAGLFLLSAAVDMLRWIQPCVFLALSPVAIITDSRGIYGLGFYIMGILLLERAGFFASHRSLRVIVVLSFLFIVEIIAVLVSKRPLADAVSPTFFIIAFGVFLWFLYRDRLVVILKEPKQAISLSERGLSQAERAFVLATLGGKSYKEIAADFELKESTIRNTLVRAYKKLGIEDRVGLAVMGERYDITD